MMATTCKVPDLEMLPAVEEPTGTTQIPHDAEAEQAVIGAVLYDPTAFQRVALDANDFFIFRNRWIWEAFAALDARGDAIDCITAADELRRLGKLADVGGDAHLTALLGACSTSLHAESYARNIKDRALRRRMLQEANDQARRAYDLKTPLPEIANQPAVKSRWNISELLSTEFPNPAGPVPGIIPTGLTLLGGRPKRGKSWLMLQCAYSLAIGGKFLDRDLEIIPVLYYALEDTPRRLKDRLAKFNPEPSALIEFDRELKPLHLGGLDQVEKAADDHALIVIDTLARAMPGRDFTKDGALFADVMGRLQSIALAKNISIVVILHTRKPNGIERDPVDDILGSTGMTASPDCVLALYREQGKPGAALQGRGRDFDDIDLTIEFDPLTCAWQLVGTTSDVRLSEDEAEILDALQELGKAKVSTIAKAINKDRSNTSKRCASLWTKGKVRKEEIEGATFYYLPTQATYTTHPTQGTQDTQPV
jgi:hypothetical protein